MACFNLSIVNNSESGSRGDDAFNASYSLMNKIINSFSSRSHNREMEATAENGRRFHQYTLKESTSSNKEQSSSELIVASSSNHMSEISSVNCSGGVKVCKGKALMYSSEVERLNDRLITLEEEAEIMKQAFLESMEERKKLMNEICQQFRVIHRCLRSGKQVTRDKSTDGVLVVNPHQNGGAGTGLSQVLHQQSNPSLVIRDLRPTLAAFEEPADTYEFPYR